MGFKRGQVTHTHGIYGVHSFRNDPDSKEADMYREAIYKIYDRLKVQKGEEV